MGSLVKRLPINKKIMQKMGLEHTTHAGNTARKGLPRYTYSCNNQKIIKSISE